VSLQALVALEAYFRSIVEGIECRIEHIILYIQSVLYSVLRASGVSILKEKKIPAPTESKRRAKDSKVVAVHPLFFPLWGSQGSSAGDGSRANFPPFELNSYLSLLAGTVGRSATLIFLPSE
jgi:hypothetical protein